MAAKTVGDLSGWTTQVFDVETVNISSTDWTPTKAGGATSAVMCVTGGTPKLDMLGVNGASPTTAFTWPIAWTAGQIYQIAVTKIYHSGSSGTYLALY